MDHLLLLLCSISVLPLLPAATQSATFRVTNNCPHTIYPALLSGATSPPLPTTGFSLPSSHSQTLTIPSSWSGRIWARTHCSLNSTTLRFSCLTADCGSGSIQCSGNGAVPPATLAEFTLDGAGGLDFYDVSLVDGFNLPMLVAVMGKRRGGTKGDCSATGCLVDLNEVCPVELRVMGGDGVLACRSACEAFGDARYCCSGEFSTPESCAPSVYSEVFKNACPRAYSYAYDDKTSTFTCAAPADYLIMFCPPPYSSEVLLGARRMADELPLVNKSMMYLHVSGGSLVARGSALVQMIACAVTALSSFFGF